MKFFVTEVFQEIYGTLTSTSIPPNHSNFLEVVYIALNKPVSFTIYSSRK